MASVKTDETMKQEKPITQELSQSDKFAAAARELGCDEDESRWEGNLRMVAMHKSPPEAGGKPGKGEE